MNKYKEIDLTEYYFKLKDLIVFVDTQPTLIKNLLKKASCSLAIFNWDGKQENTEIENLRYIDEKIDVDIEYVEKKCVELFAENRYGAVLINDFDNKVKNDNNLGKKLKLLAEELNTIVIVETNLKRSKKRLPLLKDIENQELVKNADVVVFREMKDGNEIIAKNKYGKTGIIKMEEES